MDPVETKIIKSETNKFKTILINIKKNFFNLKVKAKLQIRYRRLFSALLVFLVLFVVFSYFNYESKPLLSSDDKCLCDSVNDQYTNPLKYNYGKFKGMCVNSCTRRSSYLVQANKFDKHIRIVNLLHEDQFWSASIPLSSIEKTQILFENFTLKLNHVSIKFIFKNKIKLYSQDLNRPLRSKFLKENSIVFSPEAAPPERASYDLFDGFMGRYGIVFRGYSAEYYKLMTHQLKHETKFKTLKLDSKESQRLFLFSFMKFYEVPMPNYQLLFNNCATLSIDLILDSKNLLRSKGWDLWDFLDPLRGLPASSPIGTIRSLYWWKLVDEEFTAQKDVRS